MNLDKLLLPFFREKIALDVDLKDKSTLRTGGSAKYLIRIEDPLDLEKIFQIIAREDFPYFFLGRGSNSLFPIAPIEGLVIQSLPQQKKYSIKKDLLVLDGSIYLPQVIKIAHQNQLIGMEFAAGIPGTIGASVRMNAGTKNGELASVLEWIKVGSREGVFVVSADERHFSYRHSDLPDDWFVMEVAVRLKKAEQTELTEAKEMLKSYLSFRNKTQPLNQPTLGSTFVNPPGNFSAKLIEECGLKGKSVGGISISHLHANFLVNDGTGDSDQVLEIVDIVKKTVEKEKGVLLQTEICAIGFDASKPCGERI